MTSAEVSAVLRSLGIEHSVVFDTDPRTMVVSLDEGDCSYDALARISSRFGTTDISFSYEREHEYSEVTFEGSRARLVIRLLPGSMWSEEAA